jgi:hypothetical protein
MSYLRSLFPRKHSVEIKIPHPTPEEFAGTLLSDRYLSNVDFEARSPRGDVYNLYLGYHDRTPYSKVNRYLPPLIEINVQFAGKIHHPHQETDAPRLADAVFRTFGAQESVFEGNWNKPELGRYFYNAGVLPSRFSKGKVMSWATDLSRFLDDIRFLEVKYQKVPVSTYWPWQEMEKKERTRFHLPERTIFRPDGPLSPCSKELRIDVMTMQIGPLRVHFKERMWDKIMREVIYFFDYLTVRRRLRQDRLPSSER